MSDTPTADQINDLTLTLELIEKSREHPVEMADLNMFMVWDQHEFVQVRTFESDVLVEGACGTAACLCGTRALMDGAKVQGFNTVVFPNRAQLSNAHDWTVWGAERFGIDLESALRLFEFSNTMRQLRFYVAEIAAGRLPLTYVADFDLEVDGWEE